jgi:Tol biopolymer transport system component
MTGQTVSHYRILEKLGGGGMGVVYKAEDIKLGRFVALKFLPEELAKDHQALERFKREARAASALNHPNICTIHEIDEYEGQPFIAMELLKGETLKQRVAVGARHGVPLPTDRLLELAIQIADALDAAHAEGIVHRDIKPANMFVTNRGQAKILDFGLAKLTGSAGVSPAGIGERGLASAGGTPALPGQDTPTASIEPEHLTSPGVAMGTVAYMSPEQARGEELDARTDLFSFGAVLYEMATGRQPFAGNTSAMIFTAILTQAPTPPVRLNPECPAELERIINKALEKDPKLRYQTAPDLRADLQRLKRDTDSGRAARAEMGAAATMPVTARSLGRLAWLKYLAAFGMLMAGAFVAYRYWPPKAPGGLAKVTQISHWNKPMDGAVLSPDGRTMAFTSPAGGFDQVFVMLTSGGAPLQLTNDAGSKYVNSFSPDGTEINYELTFGGEEVWAVPTLGGAPRRVVSGSGLVTSPDGNSLFFFKSDSRAVFRTAKSALAEELVYSPSGTDIFPLKILPFPDGRDLLIAAGKTSQSPFGFAAVSPTLGLYKVNAATHGAEKLVEISGSPGGVVWGVPGRSLYLHRTVNDLTNLWEYSLTERALKQITFGAGPDLSPMPDPVRKGIYFVNGKRSGTLTVYHFRAKQSLDLVTENATQPLLSLDGRRVAYLRLAGTGRQELWVSDLDGNNTVKLASSVNLGTLAWSPDSSKFAFSDVASEGTKIYIIKADGSSLRQVTWSGAGIGWATWSPDAKTFYFSGYEKDPKKWTTWEASADGSNVKTLVESCGSALDASPDGRYLLSISISTEEGKTGIYQISVTDRKCAVLVPGVATFIAHFSSDGRSILYPVASRGEVVIYHQPWHDGKVVGPAQAAVKLPFAFRQEYWGNAYDFSKDLSTIVYARPGGQADLYLLSAAQ